jgi:hypothetical protein
VKVDVDVVYIPPAPGGYGFVLVRIIGVDELKDELSTRPILETWPGSSTRMLSVVIDVR